MSRTGPAARGGRQVRAVAVLLAVAGVVLTLGAGWHWLSRVRQVAHQQAQLEKALEDRWAAPDTGVPGAGVPGAGAPGAGAPEAAAPAGAVAAKSRSGRPREARSGPAPGTPIARLHLPTLGVALVVVEGAGDAQLDKGPGRIAGSAPFGTAGNAAVAGHRYPGVFWDLDQLAVDDPVVLETAGSWLVYRTVRTVVVAPQDGSVLTAPPADTPPVLTLVTCEPKLSTAQRLVKQAVLVRTDPRNIAPPRELQVPSRR